MAVNRHQVAGISSPRGAQAANELQRSLCLARSRTAGTRILLLQEGPAPGAGNIYIPPIPPCGMARMPALAGCGQCAGIEVSRMARMPACRVVVGVIGRQGAHVVAVTAGYRALAYVPHTSQLLDHLAESLPPGPRIG